MVKFAFKVLSHTRTMSACTDNYIYTVSRRWPRNHIRFYRERYTDLPSY